MATTTDYGTWLNHGDRHNLTPEGTLLDAINGGDAEWRVRVETSGAFDRMAQDYRHEIEDALPRGVSLVGNDFIGPFYEVDRSWDGELDIRSIIEEIDLTEIIERHDPDYA